MVYCVAQLGSTNIPSFSYLEDGPPLNEVVNPPLQGMKRPILKGEQPQVGDLLTMVIDYLLARMILQVVSPQHMYLQALFLKDSYLQNKTGPQR